MRNTGFAAESIQDSPAPTAEEAFTCIRHGTAPSPFRVCHALSAVEGIFAVTRRRPPGRSFRHEERMICSAEPPCPPTTALLHDGSEASASGASPSTMRAEEPAPALWMFRSTTAAASGNRSTADTMPFPALLASSTVIPPDPAPTSRTVWPSRG